MTEKKTSLRAWLAASVSIFILMGTALFPSYSFAQSGNITLNINNCDDNNYPDIVCTVTPVDQAGVPVQNLPASAFEVVDGTTTLDPATIKVEQIENPAVKTNIMLVVDFGTSSNSKTALADLRQSAEQILINLAPDDEVGLIGVTGNIDLGDANNPPINPSKESGFVNAGSQRNGVINIIRTLQAVPGTPLYDALCKSISLTKKQSVGARAIILLSDGKDVGSKVCKADDPLNNASSARVPVYAIGIGGKVDEAYMQRLALQTGGSYLQAPGAADVAPKFNEIQKALKTQYRISFKGVTAADNDPKGHSMTLRVNTASGKASENATFKALFPIKPIVQSANFKLGETAIDLSAPLPFGEIEVTPNMQARNIARVEYLVDGEIVKVAEQAPFAYSLDTTKLDAERDHVLIIRAYGEMTNPANITEAKYTFKVEPPPATATPLPAGTTAPAQAAATKAPVGKGTVQPTSVPLPTATPTPTGLGATLQRNPLLGGLLALVLLGIAALVGMMVVLQRRRAQATRIAAAANEPQTIMDLGPSVDAGSPAENQTKIFGTGGLSGVGDGKTKVFRPGKATLEFTNGKMKDKKFQVGVGGMDAVLVGREVDAVIGNIKIESEFVSRRHARITLEGDQLYLYDLGSASGTRVNGATIAGRTELKDNDTIEFGDSTATVKMNASARPITPAQ